MSNVGTAISLAGLVMIAGCGRIGFDLAGGNGGDAGGDGAVGGDGGGPMACVTRSSPLTNTTTRSEYPKLVWNGSKLGVGWIEEPFSAPAVYFRTAALGGSVDPVFNLGAMSAVQDLDVAWDGASWRLAWTDGNAEIVRSTDGAPAQALTASAQSDIQVRVVPLPGGKTAYLWARFQNGTGYDLLLTVLDASGAKLVNELQVVKGLGTTEDHDVSWTGSELVAIYASGTQLSMLRMASDGTPIASPIQIATASVSHGLTAGWTGDRFLVTWYTPSGIRTCYVSPAGALLSPIMASPVSATAVLTGVSAAVGSTSDVVTWSDLDARSSYLLPIARDGTLGALVSFPQSGSISAAWAGTTWVVAASQGMIPRDIYLLQLCP